MRMPIPNTCPTIDKYISYIKAAILSDDNDIVADELKCCIDYLEELRESNSILRDWAFRLEEEKKELEDRVYELEREEK